MGKATVERAVASTSGVIAGLGMLLCAVGASFFDGWLHSHWGDDGLRHEEIVEVLPYFFWFAVWFGLLLGRREFARVVCDLHSLCWAAAGALLGRVAFQWLIGDLALPNHDQQWTSPNSIEAAAGVIVWVCTLTGAMAGAAMAWLISPQRSLPHASEQDDRPLRSKAG